MSSDWENHKVVLMKGGKDTRKGKAGRYGVTTLGEIFRRETPTALAKGDGDAIIPSSYCEADARVHAVQRERGSYGALVYDVDDGNHDLETLDGLVVEFFGENTAALIYSTATATADNRKWRIIIPLAKPMTFTGRDPLMRASYAFFESHGVKLDRTLLRAGQIMYLQNVPPEHRAGGLVTGAPVFFDFHAAGGEGVTAESGLAPEWIARWRREMEAEDVAKEAARASATAARALKPPREGSSIEAFNRANPLADMLSSCEYIQSPHNDDDWQSPHQTSGSYATRIYRNSDGTEYFVSLSGSDAKAEIGAKAASGVRYGDAFDLKVHYDHGNDIKAALRALPPPPPNAGRYLLIPTADLVQRPPIRWRVKGVLPAEGIAAIYGQPGSGKTFISMDILGAIARKVPWFAHKTYACHVTYVALEGEAGIAQRVKAYVQKHGPLPVNVHFVAQSFNLLTPEDVADLSVAIITAGGRGGVICIDTLNRASSGADENDSRDMGRIIEAAKQLQREVGGLVILVHHSGKNQAMGLRGHSSLLAALDASIEVVKTEVQSSWKIAKSKDGRDDRFGVFHLETIDLGVDADGEAITSCVVMPSDGPALPAKALTPQQQQGVDAYVRAAERHGMWKDGKFVGLETERWREEYYRRTTSDTADARRRGFKRIRDAFVKQDLLVVDGEINILRMPAVQSLTPPIGVNGEAIAGFLMRDSGTLAGQSRDMSPDS